MPIRFTGRMVEGGQEAQIECPACGRERAFVNIYKQVGFCHRCGHTIHRKDLEDRYNPAADRRLLELTHVPALVDPWKDDDAANYLKGRHIHANHPWAPNVRYDPEQRRLYFAITSPDNHFPTSYHTRGLDGGWVAFPGTAKQHYWFGSPLGKRAVLVEGIGDAFMIGPGAIALLGTKLSSTHLAGLKELGVEYTCVWLDPDDAGREAAKTIDLLLHRSGFGVLHVQAEEPGDLWPDHPVIDRVREWLHS